MKIVVVQDYLRSGGTERQSILLTRGFTAAGHPSTLLTFRPGGPLAATFDDVGHRSLQPFDLGLDWFAPGLSGRIEQLGADVVLCMGRMANCYAGDLQRDFAHRSIIATMRTGKPLPRLFRRSLHLVSHVIANSHDARHTLLAQHDLADDKITVIHNSLVFPPPASFTRNDLLRQQHGAGPATRVLLNVAMFRPEKNQRELIEIAATLPASSDWQLWLAGDGPARAACEQLIAEKNLGARVKLLGFHADPSPLYAAADFAVHASWSESLSNFLIEAQAHGLPAVAYEAQGIRECFVPDRTGWAVAPGNRAGFVAVLARLFAETPEISGPRRAEARTFARATFAPERQVTAHLALFQKLSHRRLS